MQQLVAIARAIDVNAKVLILDEPTSSLDADEVAELFRVIRSLKEQGVAILFVSHFLDQVYEICDRLTVLRNGQLVEEYLVDELLRIDLVQKMIGKELTALDDLEQRARSVVVDESDAATFVSASQLGRRGAITRPTCRSRPARSWGWRACSAPAGPSSRACSAASTARTRAS